MPELPVASIEIIRLNVDHTKDLMRPNAFRRNTIIMVIFSDRYMAKELVTQASQC